MKIKNLLVTTLAVAAGLTLTACQSDKSEGASTSQEGEAVTLNFGAMGSIDTIPFVIAQENGYFEEEGIKVNLELFNAAKDRDAALQAGQLDGVLADETAIAIYQNSDMDMQITGATNGYWTLVATGQSNIHSLEDLKGKKIGGPKGTILHQVLVAALKEQKMTIKDVNFVDMQIPDAVTALSSGEIDCALVAGPSALQCLNSGSKKVCDGEGLVSGITVIAVNSEFAEKYPDLVKRFMKVHDETLDYMKDNYDDMISKVAKELDISEDDVKSLYEWYDFDDDIDDEEIKALYDTQDFLLENDMQQNKIKIEDYILDVD